MATGVINAAYPSSGTSTNASVAVPDSRYAPEVFALKMLKRFYGISAYELISNTDYEGDIKKAGDNVVIRRAPEMTIRPYDQEVDLIYDTPSASAIELPIDQAFYWAYQLDDIDEVAADQPLMNKFSENCALQLKVHIDTNCLASFSTGAHADNQGATAGAISQDIDLGINLTPRVLTPAGIMQWIHQCNQVLDEQNIPEYDRWIVLPAWIVSMLKDSDIKAANVTGDGTAVMRTGVLGMIDGFTLIRSNHLPWDNANKESTVIFGTKEAPTFAMQLTNSEHVRIPKRFGKYVQGLAVFGRTVVQSTAIGTSIVSK